jgi:hypothetical protein
MPSECVVTSPLIQLHATFPGDGRTAEDLRIFLLRFLTRFPGLQDTPLYIAGESCEWQGKHTGPTLPWLS